MRLNTYFVVAATIVVSFFTGIASADEVTFWNEQALAAIRTTGLNPPKSARALAMMHIAVYDAINSVDQHPRAPYHYSTIADPSCSREACTAKAAYDVLVAIFPTQAATLAAALNTRMALIPDGAPKTDGANLGSAVAADILALRAADGSGFNPPPFNGGPAIGQWRPTLPSFASGLLPAWGSVTPFTMTSGSQFRMGKPPAMGSGPYVAAHNEVRLLGSATSAMRSADQSNIALFWADGGGTSTPPGHWNRIAQTVVTSAGTTMSENARLFALMNMAMADAGISCWDMKYTYVFWRPITAIRENDNNPRTIQNTTWTPFIPTPPFPGYTSGHSTFSAAAATILKKFFGNDNISFTSTAEGFAVPNRSFTSFSQAAVEAMNSRLYGGIHFRFDNEVGLQAGNLIGDQCYQNYLQ